MRYAAFATVTLVALLSSAPARADFYSGKIDLVADSNSSSGARFFVRAKKLSLFATGDVRDVLLRVFFHKSSASISYTAIKCPGGVSGACGNVTSVSVDVSNLPR